MKKSKLLFIAMILVIAVSAYAETTRFVWKYMNFDPNVTVGFENNVNLLQVDAPNVVKQRAISKWNNKVFSGKTICCGDSIFGGMIYSGKNSGKKQKVFYGYIIFSIEKIKDPDNGKVIASNGEIYAKTIVDTMFFAEMDSTTSKKYNCHEGQGVKFTFLYFGDGFSGQPQCNNFCWDWRVIEPSQQQIVAIEPAQTQQDVVAVHDTLYVSAPISEDRCDAEYLGNLWISHSQDHFEGILPDSLSTDGEFLYNIHRKNMLIFTLIGGGEFKFLFDGWGLIFPEFELDNEVTVLSGHVHVGVEHFCKNDSTGSKRSIQFGPEWKFFEFPYWKRTFTSELDNGDMTFVDQEHRVFVSELGLYSKLRYEWERNNFTEFYAGQMLRNENSLKLGQSELKNVTRVRTAHWYFFLASDWKSFPRQHQPGVLPDSIMVPKWTYWSIEPRIGVKFYESSSWTFFLRYRAINKTISALSHKRYGFDHCSYNRRDYSIGFFWEPQLFLGLHNFWSEGIVGYSHIAERYKKFVYLNTDDDLMEAKLTFGWSFFGALKKEQK